MVVAKGRPQDNWVEQLSLLADARKRRRLFLDNLGSDAKELIDHLYEEVLRLVRVDLIRASRVAQASEWLADRCRDAYIRAQSLRARGHA